MRAKTLVQLILAIAVSELAGAAGSMFTFPAISSGWYAALPKPELTPPAWVFGPAWTLLYALMGVAAFLVWKGIGGSFTGAKSALQIFVIQLILNAEWSIAFFGFQDPGVAFIVLISLWLAILATILAFRPLSRPAAWLLVPCFLWVSFAGYLNFSIWRAPVAAPARIACTMEAKLCPDGSYVERRGPNCEFAGCPAAPAIPQNWRVSVDPAQGISFRYPEHLPMSATDTTPTAYLDAYDWPPKLALAAEPFTCATAGSLTARAGETRLETLGGRSYCVTREIGAAAGSVYTQYAYAFPLPAGGKVGILTFTIRAPQCPNYGDAARMAACEKEERAFDVSGIIDLIAQSVRIQ